MVWSEAHCPYERWKETIVMNVLADSRIFFVTLNGQFDMTKVFLKTYKLFIYDDFLNLCQSKSKKAILSWLNTCETQAFKRF